jgi:hypothetical protein
MILASLIAPRSSLGCRRANSHQLAGWA